MILTIIIIKKPPSILQNPSGTFVGLWKIEAAWQKYMADYTCGTNGSGILRLHPSQMPCADGAEFSLIRSPTDCLAGNIWQCVQR